MSTATETEQQVPAAAPAINPEELQKRIEALEQKAHAGEAAISILDEMSEANKEVRKCLAEFVSKRESARAAKANLETAKDKLSELVEAWENDLDRPLLTQPRKKKEPSTPQPADAIAEPADDSWRKMSVSAAGFTEKAEEALKGADIQTLGELQDRMTRHGMNWAKESGVHGRYKEAIEKAFNDYLNEIQAGQQAPPAAEGQGTASEPPSAPDAAPVDPDAWWPNEIAADTIGFLKNQGIDSLESLQACISAGVRIAEIPGVTAEQASLVEQVARGELTVASDWRDVPLDDSGFCKRARTALEKMQLTTMGAVYDWIAAGNSFESLQAVGGPTAQKTAAILDAFCQEHGVAYPAAPADETQTPVEMQADTQPDNPAPVESQVDTTDPDGIDTLHEDDLIDDLDDDEENYFDDDDDDDDQEVGE